MTKHRDADLTLLKGTRNYALDLWRSVEIWHEFRKGVSALNKVNNCVTFFGSSRFNADHEYYKLAYETAYKVAKKALRS